MLSMLNIAIMGLGCRVYKVENIITLTTKQSVYTKTINFMYISNSLNMLALMADIARPTVCRP